MISQLQKRVATLEREIEFLEWLVEVIRPKRTYMDIAKERHPEEETKAFLSGLLEMNNSIDAAREIYYGRGLNP